MEGAGVHRGQNAGGLHAAPGEQHAPEEVRVFAHAQGAHQAFEVGHVDVQPDIALQKPGAALLGQIQHILKIGPVQHKVAQLGVPGGAQGFPGGDNGLGEPAGQSPEVGGADTLLKLGGRDPPGVHQQLRSVYPPGPRI